MLRLCEAITPGDVPAFNTCSHLSVKWNIWFYYLCNPGFCHIACLNVACFVCTQHMEGLQAVNTSRNVIYVEIL